MSVAYTAQETLVAVQCGECGVWFGMTERFYEFRQDDGMGWYCPNGHCRVYGKNTLAKRLKRTEAALAQEERRRKAAQDLLAAEERSHTATRGHLTRQRKRASAGVCPCCQRTFQQLARHMKSKHPGYDPAKA